MSGDQKFILIHTDGLVETEKISNVTKHKVGVHYSEFILFNIFLNKITASYFPASWMSFSNTTFIPAKSSSPLGIICSGGKTNP